MHRSSVGEIGKCLGRNILRKCSFANLVYFGSFLKESCARILRFEEPEKPKIYILNS